MISLALSESLIFLMLYSPEKKIVRHLCNSSLLIFPIGTMFQLMSHKLYRKSGFFLLSPFYQLLPQYWKEWKWQPSSVDHKERISHIQEIHEATRKPE